MADEYNGLLGALPPTPVVIYGYIYSNDGETLLDSYTSYPQSGVGPLFYYYEEDGDNPRGIYDVWGGKRLITDLSEYSGLSTTPNATNPDVADDTVMSGTFYVVEGGGGGGSMLDVTYNGSKIIDGEEVTPPIAVTYNGSTIATLNEGDTKTLDILGSDNKPKILATPIVIGGKTIPDVDALGRKWVLEHNLEVEVRGGNANG